MSGSVSGGSDNPKPHRPTLKHDSIGSCDGHVHFNEGQITEDHAGRIQVQLSPDGTHADAHLGFLQFGRRYEIQLQMNRHLGDNITVAKVNPNVNLKKITNSRDGQVLVTELTPSKDKLLNEHLELNTDSGPFVVMMSARVLGHGKGTPMLKSGIKCIGVDSEDSEMSDCSTQEQRRRPSLQNIVGHPKIPEEN